MSMVYSPKAGRSKYTDSPMAGVMGGGKPVPSISGPLAADLTVSGLDAATFTRSTTGTFTDYEGVLRTAAINEPRFDGGRRVENLCLQSATLTSSSWSKSGLTAEIGFLRETALSEQHSIRQNFASVSQGTYALWASVKYGGTRYLSIYPQGTTGQWAIFDILNKAKLGTSGCTSFMFADPTDPQYSVVGIVVNRTAGNIYFHLYLASTLTPAPNYLGNILNGLFIRCIQIENITGSAYQLPSEYVQTTGAAASKWFTTKPDGSPIYPAPKLLMEGQSQNKITAKTANPVDLTGVTKAGDAAAVLSVVDDTAALDAAGLSALCPSRKVYKLDNSLGTTDARANITGGTTGNTNVHTASVYMRCPVWVAATNYVTLSDGSSVDITNYGMQLQSSYIKRWVTKTPGSSAAIAQVWARAGNIVYFILPVLEELPVASSVIPNDTGSPLTRTADACSWPLSTALQAMLSAEGTIALDWVPGFIPPASQIGIVSCAAAVDSLLSVAAGASVTRSTDGTTPITGGATLVTNTQRKLILRWSAASGKYQISSIASGVVSHGTESNFDGAFTLGANLLLHYSNAYPARYSNMKIFNRRLSTSELSRL